MPGSGKSTVGRMLAERLGYHFYSMGDLRGKMALDRGITIDQLNELGTNESWTDREVDDYQKKLGETEDNFIVDGLISFHFIPHAFKVFISVDPRVAAERIQAHPRPDEPRVESVEAQQKQIAKRIQNNEDRYKKHYGITFRDPLHFDLVIDSSDSPSPAHTADRILAALPKTI